MTLKILYSYLIKHITIDIMTKQKQETLTFEEIVEILEEEIEKYESEHPYEELRFDDQSH